PCTAVSASVTAGPSAITKRTETASSCLFRCDARGLDGTLGVFHDLSGVGCLRRGFACRLPRRLRRGGGLLQPRLELLLLLLGVLQSGSRLLQRSFSGSRIAPRLGERTFRTLERRLRKLAALRIPRGGVGARGAFRLALAVGRG